jgi:hypothetical protein
MYGQDKGHGARPNWQLAGVSGGELGPRRCPVCGLQHPDGQVDADHRPSVAPAGELGQVGPVPAADVHDDLVTGPDGKVHDGAREVDAWLLVCVDALACAQVGFI